MAIARSTRARFVDFGRIVRETADGVVCVDDDGGVVFANRAAEQMFRRTLEGARWGDVIVGDGAVPKPVDDGAMPRRISGRRSDGTVVALDASIARHTGDGRTFFSAILREDGAANRRAVVVELAREHGAFLAAVAHQLRSPLQAVVTSLRTIEQALRSGKPVPSDTMPRALRQTARLSRLVESVLRDSVDLERRQLKLDIGPFDVAELVGDIVDDFRLATPSHRFEFECSGPVLVTSDRVRVHQVVAALIENAVKYSPVGEAVTIQVGASREAAWIRVIDRGIGIPVGEQPSILTKFYRAANAPTYASGLGIGLYLAHGITERLGGTLVVRSEEGRGSTFVVTLPRSFVRGASSVADGFTGWGDPR